MNPGIRYLIADDEPLLARALAAQLADLWAEAACAGLAGNGEAALRLAAETQPEVLFLDIRMPGKSGLEVAAELLARHAAAPSDAPHIVFVTAYNEYAVDAFEQAAVDYLLKPVEPARLQRCVERLKQRLAQPDDKTAVASGLAGLPTGTAPEILQMLGTLLQQKPATPALRHIRAGSGSSVRLIPVEEVLYFNATDKYLSVVTADGEALIRSSLREIQAQLDPDQFWQIHRSTLVNVRTIRKAERDALGRWHIELHQRTERLPVSRQFAHLFRQM